MKYFYIEKLMFSIKYRLDFTFTSFTINIL